MNSFQDSADSNCLANACGQFVTCTVVVCPALTTWGLRGLPPSGAGRSGGLLLRFWQGRESEGNKHQQLVGKPQTLQQCIPDNQKPHLSVGSIHFRGWATRIYSGRKKKPFSKALVKGWKGQGLRQDMSREDMLQVDSSCSTVKSSLWFQNNTMKNASIVSLILFFTHLCRCQLSQLMFHVPNSTPRGCNNKNHTKPTASIT